MHRFAKAVVLALTALVLVAPLAAVADCADSHESECAAACACTCTCHTAVALADPEPVFSLAAPDRARRDAADNIFAGDRLPIDIFRPPAGA